MDYGRYYGFNQYYEQILLVVNLEPEIWNRPV